MIFRSFSDFYGQHSVTEPGPNLVLGGFLKMSSFLTIRIKGTDLALKYLKMSRFGLFLSALKIVENHTFSQEGKGVQNCLCRKVGPFVEAWCHGTTDWLVCSRLGMVLYTLYTVG